MEELASEDVPYQCLQCGEIVIAPKDDISLSAHPFDHHARPFWIHIRSRWGVCQPRQCLCLKCDLYWCREWSDDADTVYWKTMDKDRTCLVCGMLFTRGKNFYHIPFGGECLCAECAYESMPVKGFLGYS